jgi:hypothetical protein
VKKSDFRKALEKLAAEKSLGPTLTIEPSDEEKRQRWEKQKAKLARALKSR